MDSRYKPTEPGSVLPNRRYWLREDGTAFEVDDHLTAAHYAQSESDEYDRRMPWGYEDMFRHGWMRVHTEKENIWVDGAAGREATAQQQQWIDAAAGQISAHVGGKVAVASAVQKKAQIIADGDEGAEPTRTFLQRLGFAKRRH